MSFLDTVKEKSEKVLNDLNEKISNLPEDHPLKKAARFIADRFTEERKDVSSSHVLFPKPIVPERVEKESVKKMRERLGPKEWEKKAEKIKKNIKKLTVHAANITTKLLILQTKLAGKAIKWGGRITKAAGYGIRTIAWTGKFASWGLEYSGKFLKLLGGALQKGGENLTRMLASSKIGIVLTPVSGALTVLGMGTKAVGIGSEKVGRGSQKIFSNMDRAGKATVQTGHKMTRTGKSIEKTADRMDKIRKYYKVKALNHIQKKTSKDAQQRNLMRLKNPLAFEAMNKPQRKSIKTAMPFVLTQNRKKQK